MRQRERDCKALGPGNNITTGAVGPTGAKACPVLIHQSQREEGWRTGTSPVLRGGALVRLGVGLVVRRESTVWRWELS